MAIYSLAQRTTNFNAGQAQHEIIAASDVCANVLEYCFIAPANTNCRLWLGFPQAVGITPTSPVAVLAEDGGNVATGKTTAAVAWATSPTQPLGPIKQASGQTLGMGKMCQWPRGLTIGLSQSLCLFNIINNGSGSGFDVWFVVDE